MPSPTRRRSPGSSPKWAQAGLLGVTVPEEYGGLGAGYVSYGLVAREIERIDSGLSLDDVGAVEPGDVSDPCLWLGGAAPQISARAGQWLADRLLRPDRARGRIGPRRHEDPRHEGAGRLCAERVQDVDLERADRRCLRGLGQVRGAWRQDPRLRAGEGHEGADARRRSRASFQLRASRHRRDRAAGCRSARGRAAARRRGAERPVRLPQPRPLRHRLGGDGRGRGLFPRRLATMA